MQNDSIFNSWECRNSLCAEGHKGMWVPRESGTCFEATPRVRVGVGTGRFIFGGSYSQDCGSEVKYEHGTKRKEYKESCQLSKLYNYRKTNNIGHVQKQKAKELMLKRITH